MRSLPVQNTRPYNKARQKWQTLHKDLRFNRSLNLRFSLIEGTYWMVMGCLNGYLITLLQHRGFSMYLIGIMLAAKTMISLLSQLSLSAAGDYFYNIPIKYMAAGCVALCFVANATLSLTRPSFAGTLALIMVMGATENSIVSLLDSLSMQFLNTGFSIHYSACRSAGSFCYAVLCLGLGRVVDHFSPEIILTFHGILLVALFVSVISFPRFDPAWKALSTDVLSPAASEAPSIRKMFLSCRFYPLFLAASCFASVGYSANSNYLVSIVRNIGGNNQDAGLAMFVSAISQVPMMLFFFPKLSKKLSPVSMILISLFSYILLWGLTALTTDISFLILLQTLQILAYGLYLPTCILYINQMIPDPNKIKGQTFFMIAGNLGATIGNYISGYTIEAFSCRTMILINVGFLAIAAALTFPGIFSKIKE